MLNRIRQARRRREELNAAAYRERARLEEDRRLEQAEAQDRHREATAPAGSRRFHDLHFAR